MEMLLSSLTFVEAGVTKKMQELGVGKNNSIPPSEHSSREAIGNHLLSSSTLCTLDMKHLDCQRSYFCHPEETKCLKGIPL
jgi:hypothetical protein